jgi:hypothetical protein
MSDYINRQKAKHENICFLFFLYKLNIRLRRHAFFSLVFLPFCFYLLAYFDNKLFFRRLSIVRNQLTRKEKWFCHWRPGDSVIFYFFSIFIIFYYDWRWSLESRRARLIFVINTDWHSSLCICVAIYNQKRKKMQRPWAENRARRFFSLSFTFYTFKLLSTFRAMTTSQICLSLELLE